MIRIYELKFTYQMANIKEETDVNEVVVTIEEQKNVEAPSVASAIDKLKLKYQNMPITDLNNSGVHNDDIDNDWIIVNIDVTSAVLLAEADF